MRVLLVSAALVAVSNALPCSDEEMIAWAVEATPCASSPTCDCYTDAAGRLPGGGDCDEVDFMLAGACVGGAGGGGGGVVIDDDDHHSSVGGGSASGSDGGGGVPSDMTYEVISGGSVAATAETSMYASMEDCQAKTNALESATVTVGLPKERDGTACTVMKMDGIPVVARQVTCGENGALTPVDFEGASVCSGDGEASGSLTPGECVDHGDEYERIDIVGNVGYCGMDGSSAASFSHTFATLLAVAVAAVVRAF